MILAKFVDFLPSHSVPSPRVSVKPELHAQLNDPDTLVQTASSAQLSVSAVHSLISKNSY